MNKLTAKQARFVAEYLIDLNATQAAIRAGYSEKTASETGYENLRKPQIAEAVQKALAERSERTEVTQDYVLTAIKDTIEQYRGGGEGSNGRAQERRRAAEPDISPQLPGQLRRARSPRAAACCRRDRTDDGLARDGPWSRGARPWMIRCARAVHGRPVPDKLGEVGEAVAKVLKTKKSDRSDVSNH